MGCFHARLIFGCYSVWCKDSVGVVCRNVARFFSCSKQKRGGLWICSFQAHSHAAGLVLPSAALPEEKLLSPCPCFPQYIPSHHCSPSTKHFSKSPLWLAWQREGKRRRDRGGEGGDDVGKGGLGRVDGIVVLFTDHFPWSTGNVECPFLWQSPTLFSWLIMLA